MHLKTYTIESLTELLNADGNLALWRGFSRRGGLSYNGPLLQYTYVPIVHAWISWRLPLNYVTRLFTRRASERRAERSFVRDVSTNGLGLKFSSFTSTGNKYCRQRGEVSGVADERGTDKTPLRQNPLVRLTLF